MKKKEVLNLVWACNENYVIPLCCSIKSVLLNANKNEFFNIFIMYDAQKMPITAQKIITKICSSDNCVIKFLDIESKRLNTCPLTKECNHVTIEAYFRFLLPEILGDLEKVLYLDCDTIILSSLSELYNTDISNDYIAGVEDLLCETICKRLMLKKYCNSGVLLFNLKKLREDDIQAKLFKYTIEKPASIFYVDQDVINVVMQNGIKIVDKIWNTQVVDSTISLQKDPISANTKIIHYICGIKPWHLNYKPSYKSFFFDYFNKLPLGLQLDNYYYQKYKQDIKSFRKKIIRYYRSEKKFVFLNKFELKL